MAAAFEPFFLNAGPGRGGQRFCIYHPPQLAAGECVRGAVVYVHPFAEEMNKSRRMAALGSRALAAQGFAVLQIDLLGCGDSEGDFADATWLAWVDDVAVGVTWLSARIEAPLWLWGLRAGALLVTEAARACCNLAGLLLWQPVTRGATHWQQFMRLRLAAELGKVGGKAATESVRSALAAGAAADIAGYRVGPGLASGLASAVLAPTQASRVIWIETSTQPEPVLTPASQTQTQIWREAGLAVEATAVPGPAFWQTSETEEAPAMLHATCELMGQPK